MKRVQFLIAWVLITALVLSGCGSALSLGAVQGAASDVTALLATATPAADLPVAASDVQTLSNPALVAALQTTFEQVYEQVNPSVVNIEVGTGGSTGFPSAGEQGALGSGFVWDTQGHIVTNNHVVEGASRITVNFSDGETAEAELVGADPDADLAVIRVDVSTDRLRPVTLADSAQVKVGQIAIAIGNPFGLSGTMTEGIISGLSRSLPVGDNSALTGGSYTIPDIIQTDAAINPGNSGGVLVNVAGEVVGVTTAIRSTTNSNSGIGFVIPSNIVNRVVQSLIETGRYEHPRIGISGLTLTAELAEAMDLPAEQKGVLVISVSANGPAARAGLQGSPSSAAQQDPTGGDVVTAIDEQPVTKFEDLTSYLFNHTQVGQTVILTILRQGREQTVPLTLGSLPLSPGQ